MFILSAGFLARKSSEQQVAQMSRQALQARELAYAGLETVRVRLLNDAKFPPSNMDAAQVHFSFSESLRSVDDSSLVGRYQIQCDRRWTEAPYSILRVVVVGQVNDESNPVTHRLTGDFLMSEGRRGELVNLQDHGTF